MIMSVLKCADQPATEPESQIDAVVRTLETDGCARLPRLIPDDVLREMQEAFASRLTGLRFNSFEGYLRGERLRLTVPDVLTVAQGFVDLAIHPFILAVL